MQEEAEEAERTAMEAIRGDARLPDVGQDNRALVDPFSVTPEDLTASIDALTRRLCNMPAWSGNLLDPVKSAELVAARWPEALLAEAGMRSASQEDRAYALTQLTEVVNFHKKHLCFGRGTPSLPANAPIRPYVPNQLD